MLDVILLWLGTGFIGALMWAYAEWEEFFVPGFLTDSVFLAIVWKIAFPMVLGPIGFLMGWDFLRERLET